MSRNISMCIVICLCISLQIFFRAILHCLKHAARREYSSLMMVVLMKKIFGKKSILHLHQNLSDDPGSFKMRVFFLELSVKCVLTLNEACSV